MRLPPPSGRWSAMRRLGAWPGLQSAWPPAPVPMLATGGSRQPRGGPPLAPLRDPGAWLRTGGRRSSIPTLDGALFERPRAGCPQSRRHLRFTATVRCPYEEQVDDDTGIGAVMMRKVMGVVGVVAALAGRSGAVCSLAALV